MRAERGEGCGEDRLERVVLLLVVLIGCLLDFGKLEFHIGSRWRMFGHVASFPDIRRAPPEKAAAAKIGCPTNPVDLSGELAHLWRGGFLRVVVRRSKLG